MYTPVLFDIRIEKDDEDFWVISRLDYNDQELITWVHVRNETRYQKILDDLELGEYRLIHSDGAYTYYRIPQRGEIV